ncbi:CHC2 zinc finger domain-containing protein [Cellulosilyticum sp. ST5]|uniref:CHC2 zinc finger domain-containing protein n=1 Tax=Cellulosilyticum sp. ST5 TaxID=3055805 RepID=UPI003977B535
MNPNYIKEEIRQRVRMSDLVERLTGAKLIKGKMLCPFHLEKTPSFFVNDKKGVFYCQGCGTGGDIFKFVQLYKGTSFSGAVGFIDSLYGFGLSNTSPTYGQYVQAKMIADKRIEEEKKEARKRKEYDHIAQDYRICVRALLPGILEPFSELWCYYINQKAYLDYLIEEGGY